MSFESIRNGYYVFFSADSVPGDFVDSQNPTTIFGLKQQNSDWNCISLYRDFYVE